MTQVEVEAQHAALQAKMTGALANYHRLAGPPAIQTYVLEPQTVPNVPDGEGGPRVNFVRQCSLLVADIGTNPQINDTIEFLEGPEAGKTWTVSDVPTAQADPAWMDVEVSPP